jgi:hypothetical protein
VGDFQLATVGAINVALILQTAIPDFDEGTNTTAFSTICALRMRQHVGDRSLMN